jgi:hypothetical protein
MAVVGFAVDTKIITHTSLSTGDMDDINIMLKIDDDGDGVFRISDPEDESNYIEADVQGIDLLISMLTRAQTIRDGLRGR